MQAEPEQEGTHLDSDRESITVCILGFPCIRYFQTFPRPCLLPPKPQQLSVAVPSGTQATGRFSCCVHGFLLVASPYRVSTQYVHPTYALVDIVSQATGRVARRHSTQTNRTLSGIPMDWVMLLG